MTGPITYAERRAAGTFEAAAAARTAELAAAATPPPESTLDTRTHVPLGADVELYNQVSSWAPDIAGFQRFDLTPSTPDLIGPPGLELVRLGAGSVLLTQWYFVLTPWDGLQPMLFVGTDLYPVLNSAALDSSNDWQNDGNVVTGDYLFAQQRPGVWATEDPIRVYAGDPQGDDPGSTTGLLIIVLRVLPAAPGYPPT